MKTKILYALSLTLGVALFASCAKGDEGLAMESQDQEVTITVTLPETTRLGVDGVDVYWEKGDTMLFYGSSSYHGSSLDQDDTTTSTLGMTSFEDNTATFTGTLSSKIAITGSKISGIYPGHEAFTNYGTNTNMTYSSLRILQPSYFQYTYTDGNLDPSSIGKYCFMHFVSNEDDATNATNLTGSVEHLMAYIDFDLKMKNKTDKVERVYFAMQYPLTYPSMKVATDGTCTMDMYVDYIIDAAGSELDHAKVNMDYIVVELTDSDTGNLGVTANDDGIIPLRIPLIPQHLVGDWNMFVVYDDGSEDIVTLNYDLVILVAGRVYNMGETIDLSGGSITNLTTATPKKGDFYYSDGTYSSNVISTKANTSTTGIIYSLVGTGADTKAGLVYAAMAGASAKLVDNSTYSGYANIITADIASYTIGLQNVSKLAEYGRTYCIDNNLSGVTSTSTIQEVCTKMFPAFAGAINRSTGTITNMTFDGTETGIWYLPTHFEIYRYNSDTWALQGLRENYYINQMERLPSTFGTLGSGNFLAPHPTDTSTWTHLSSTLSTKFYCRYVRQRAAWTLDPASNNNYVCSYMFDAFQTRQYRPIMRANAEE